MSNTMSCRRWISTFTLTFLLALPAAAVAEAPTRDPADSGRVAVMLESLWQWLGLTFGPPAVSVAGRSESDPPATENATGSGGGAGGEGHGTNDPTGTSTPPTEPNLDPEGTGTGTGGSPGGGG